MGLAFIGASAADQGATLLDWVTGLGGGPAQEFLRQVGPERAPEGKPELIGSLILKGVLEDLVALLVRKQLLTELEGAGLRGKLSD